MRTKTLVRAARGSSERAATAMRHDEESRPPRWTLGRRALTLGIAGTTIVTFPVAKAMFPGHPVAATMIGLAPLVRYTLMIVQFAILSTVAILLLMLAMIPLVVCGRADLTKCMTVLMICITNAPIAVLTLTPLPDSLFKSGGLAKPARRKASTSDLSALPPAAPGVNRGQDTPHYWRTLQNQAAKPGGAPDVVLSSEPGSGTGRHAKPGPADRTKVSANERVKA